MIGRLTVAIASLVILFALIGAPASALSQKGQKARLKLPVPFDVDKRPMPSGTDLNTLVPPVVGAFRREPFPPDVKPRSDQDLNTTYKSGTDSVFVGFSIPDTAADAYEAVKVTRREAIESKVNMKGEQYVVGKDPSYFRVADFMSWTRGRYFFYAKASTPAALEKFMRAFPF